MKGIQFLAFIWDCEALVKYFWCILMTCYQIELFLCKMGSILFFEMLFLCYHFFGNALCWVLPKESGIFKISTHRSWHDMCLFGECFSLSELTPMIAPIPFWMEGNSSTNFGLLVANHLQIVSFLASLKKGPFFYLYFSNMFYKSTNPTLGFTTFPFPFLAFLVGLIR